MNIKELTEACLYERKISCDSVHRDVMNPFGAVVQRLDDPKGLLENDLHAENFMIRAVRTDGRVTTVWLDAPAEDLDDGYIARYRVTYDRLLGFPTFHLALTWNGALVTFGTAPSLKRARERTRSEKTSHVRSRGISDVGYVGPWADDATRI